MHSLQARPPACLLQEGRRRKGAEGGGAESRSLGCWKSGRNAELWLAASMLDAPASMLSMLVGCVRAGLLRW